MSKYQLNEKFFDEINTEEKAYWLGFIWCDGSIVYRKRGENAQEFAFKVTLSGKDIDHIYKLNKSLQSTYPVKKYPIYSGFKTNFDFTAELRISRNDFGRKLYYGYNVKPYRTNINKIIEAIPEQYYKDFIRGMFDGDGSFSHSIIHNTQNKYKVCFLGSEFTLRWIEQIFIDNIENIADIKRKLRKRHPKRDGECYELGFSGRGNTSSILNWLYQDSDIYLERKYQKYLKMFN